ncbi:MAG: hypothetical protein O7C75_18215 [Verrucomicrobia bacterium]|nr:hypothetical protein [Verrucomicrobiota bacterium]
MPEFEESKPINTKTDYELNSDSFSAPPQSNQHHIPTPPTPASVNKPSPRRRSRYHSERKSAGPRPNRAPQPESAKPVQGTPEHRSEPASDSKGENRQDSATERQQRPPRQNQNRYQRGHSDDNREGEGSPNRNRNQNRNRNRHRNRNRNQNRDGEARNRDNNQQRQNHQNRSAPGKTPEKKGLIGSIISSIKGLFGIKEEEPEKGNYRRNHRPRRRKYNQGNRPQGQGDREGDRGDQQKSENGPQKQFAKKRPRRRRRRRPNPGNRQAGSSPKSDNPPSAS